MTKIVVGDIHGRVEVVEKVLSYGKDNNMEVIFVGDFMDSYDRSLEDQMRALNLALDAIEAGKAKSVYGNHDLSYMDGMTCSGWRSNTQTAVDKVAHRIKASFKPYLREEGFLISHAGVSSRLLDYYNITLEDYLTEGDFSDVGYDRGGSKPCGGLYWCDWFTEFEPIADVPQIVGHSGYRLPGFDYGILQEGNSFNVDCLQHKQEVLFIEDGEALIVGLGDLGV